MYKSNECRILFADSHESEKPFKQFGHHYEYTYETPLTPNQKPRFVFSYGNHHSKII